MDAPPPFMPTAYGNFSPDQWSNPYSLFNNQALPWPSSYVGTPTDAMGRPIASYQAPQTQQAAPQTMGTTLSSPAVSQQQGWWGPDTARQVAIHQLGTQNAMIDAQTQQHGGFGQTYDPGNNPQYNANSAMISYLQGQRPQAAQAAPAASGAPNSYAAALAALANPGPVTTPGATVPQGAPFQPGAGVLQQFLANWSPASSGPGAGFQQAFNKALKR